MPTTRTLAPAVSIGNYPQTGRVTVEERIAKRLGCTPGTAHQWMYGEQRANKRAAAIRRAMLDCGETARLLVKAIDCLRHRLLEKRAALVHRWGLEI